MYTNILKNIKLFTIFVVITFSLQAQQDSSKLILAGILDLTLPEGGVSGRGVVVRAIGQINDLSQYGVGSANNGGGTDGEELTFPNISLSEGQILFVVRNPDAYENYFGPDIWSVTSYTTDQNGDAITFNGDDAVELFYNGEVVDVFGYPDVDGTGESWEYIDAWAHRNCDALSATTNFNESDWNIAEPNCTDDGDDWLNSNCPYPYWECINSEDVNHAIEFNEPGQYVSIDHSNSLNINYDNGNQGTIMAWINLNFDDLYEDDWPRIVSKKEYWNDFSGYELDVNPHSNYITLVAGNDNFARGSLPHQNGWVHIAATFSDSTANIYFNGNDVTYDNHIDPITSNQEALLIGGMSGFADSSYNTCCWMNGYIDEVALFNVALSNSEIIDYASGELTGSESFLAAYLNFDHADSSYVYDLSANSNHGQVFGAEVVPVYNNYQIIQDDISPSISNLSFSDSTVQISNNFGSVIISSDISDYGTGLLQFTVGVRNNDGDDYVEMTSNFNGNSSEEWSDSLIFDNGWSAGQYVVDYIHLIDMVGNAIELFSNELESMGLDQSFTLYTDSNVNSFPVTFRYYPEPDENFVRIFVPGSMPSGTVSDWGPNEGGFISPDAPSIMTFNQYLNCYEKTYTLTEGLEYTYKFHIHYDSTGNDHAWIHDPLNPELDDNMWQDNLLSVTDPLIFQQKRFVTNGYDVDRFDIGIYTSEPILTVAYWNENMNGNYLTSQEPFFFFSGDADPNQVSFTIYDNISLEAYSGLDESVIIQYTNEGIIKPILPSSIEFDGGDWDDDYVTFGDVLDMGPSSFSYHTWAKFDTLNVSWKQCIVSKGASHGTTPTDNGFRLSIPENSSHIRAHLSGDLTNYVNTLSEPIETNTWYFISVIVDRENNYQKLYLNGIIQDSSDISHINSISNNGHLHLGNQYWPDTGQNAAVLDGKMFGFSFWDIAIQQDQINYLINTSLNQGEFPGNYNFSEFFSQYNNSPIAAWAFRDSTENNLFGLQMDSSSTYYDGTIVNASWSNDVPTPICGSEYVWNQDLSQCVDVAQLSVIYDFIDINDSLLASLDTSNFDVFGIGGQDWVDGALVELNLDGIGIDTIPNSIGSLAYLKSLSISYNTIQYLPDEIGNLSNLRTLYLRDNQIVQVPPSIENLYNLNHLTLWDNQLSELPSGLSNLNHLSYLDIDGNNFSEVPSVVLQMASLDTLWLNNNNISGLPINIDDLAGLILLDISGNPIQSLPNSIGNLSELRHLYMWFNQLSELPASLSNLIELNSLSFAFNQFYDFPDVVASFPNLQQLWINGNYMFCENASVNQDLIPEFLISNGVNDSVYLNIDGLYDQDCGYQLLAPVNEVEISGTSGFRLLSAPVEGKIYSDLLEELWTQGSVGSDLLDGSPNVWTYNNGWNPVVDLNNDFYEPGRGILVYAFADTDYDGEDDLPVTLSVYPDSAQEKFDLNHHHIQFSTGTSTNEWSLLGNPYGLAINIQPLLEDNPNYYSSVYVWDDSMGTYRTHNGVAGDVDLGMIRPFEGFWIQTYEESYSNDTSEYHNEFRFEYDNIITNSYGGASRTTSSEEPITGHAVFTFESGGYASSMYISFSENGDVNLDPADARRMIPMEPKAHLTSMIYESNQSLAINNLPIELLNDYGFPLDVMMLSTTETGYETQEAQINISYEISEVPEGITLALKDQSTGELYFLDGTSIEATIPAKGGFGYPESHLSNYPEVGDAQFRLYVYATMASVEEEIIPEKFALAQPYPNPFNPTTMIGYDLPMDSYVKLDVYDITGRHVAKLVDGVVGAGRQEFKWTSSQLASGIYLIRMETSERIFNRKVTFLK